MSQWEYLVLRVDLASGDRPLIRWVGSTEVENWKGSAPIWDRLNEYGDQGWELVGFELFGTRHTSVVMKRPSSKAQRADAAEMARMAKDLMTRNDPTGT